MCIYNIVKEEFESKGLVKIPSLIERFSSSVGSHLFNQMNLHSKLFFHSGMLENMRTHVMMMSPSGFGRSMLFGFLLDPKYGLMSTTNFLSTSVRGTFSKESWLGTIENRGGESIPTKGIFGKFKEGIIGADEFARFRVLCDGEGIEHDEVYLMTALDRDTATKDLASGSIEERGIGTTLWGGMRLNPINLSSGFARRFSFQLFFPTPYHAQQFSTANRKKFIKAKISDDVKERVTREIEVIRDNLRYIDALDYTVIDDWVSSKPLIPHFEESIFRRMSVGFNIAMDGQFDGKVKMYPELELLLSNEFLARSIVRDDPLKYAIFDTIDSTKKDGITKRKLENFFIYFYQVNQREIAPRISALAHEESVVKSQNVFYTYDTYNNI